MKYSYKRPWWYPWNFRVVWWLWRVKHRILYRLTGDCGLSCGDVYPYGWVPEAECPIHDK